MAHDTQFMAYKVILRNYQLLKAIVSPSCHWYLVWVQDGRCACTEVVSEGGRGNGRPAAGPGADIWAGPAFQDPLWPRAGTFWHPGAASVRTVTSSQVVKVAAVPPSWEETRPGKDSSVLGAPDSAGSCLLQ